MKIPVILLLLLSSFQSFSQGGTYVPKTTQPPTAAPKQKPNPGPSTAKTSGGTILTVSPETVPCSNNPNSQCLRIRKQGSSEYETVEDIENFNYDIGYTYTIQVKEIMKTPPIGAGESIYRYVWVKTISKKELVEETVKAESVTAADLTPKNSYTATYNNGKVIGQTTIFTGSELDKKWYLRKMKEAEGSSFVTDDNVMWIEINTFNDRIDGFGACNKFAAVVKSDLNTTFEVSKLTTNYSICGNKKVEDLFYELLQQADRFEIKNGNLILSKQWKYLLIFVSNPDNREDLNATYVPKVIVKEESTTYATDERLKQDKKIQENESMSLPTSTTSNTKDTKVEINSGNIAVDPIIAEKNKEIEELKKQLAEQKINSEKSETIQPTLPVSPPSLEKSKDESEKDKQDIEAAAIKKQIADKKVKEDEEIAVALKKQQEEEIEKSKQSTLSAKSMVNSSSNVSVTLQPEKLIPISVESNPDIINNASDNSDYPQPKNKNIVYYKSDNKLLFTEIEEAVYRGNEKNMYMELPTEESKLQFNKYKIPKLIIKTDGLKPTSDYISLYTCDFKKEKRQIYVRPSKNRVLTSFSEIAPNVYEIILPENLGEGEYVFVMQSDLNTPITFNNSKTKVFCFGVIYK